MVQTLKTVWSFLRELKLEILHEPAISLPDIYQKKKKMKVLIQKDTSMPMFIVTLFIIAKIYKQPKCPSTDEQIKMKLYIQDRILLSHKRNAFFSFAKNN